MLSYSSVLSQLYKVDKFQLVKSGLDNMHKLNNLLDHPLKNIPIIHIAGTNGKGSVSFKLAQSLQASGIRTGMFTSPHISSFRERIQVDSQLISELDVQV